MSNILTALFPLICLITLGYFIQYYRLLSTEVWSGIEKINYYLFFPVLFVYTLATAKIELQQLSWVLWVMFLVVMIATIILYIIRWINKIPPARFGVHIQSVIRFNSYISLALIAALFQQQGMAILAILLAVCVPLVNVISILALTAGQNQSIVAICKSMLKNPLIASCIIGLAMNVLHVPLWQGIQDGLKLLAAASLPLGLLCVGAALQFQQIKHDVLVLFMLSLARLLVMPALTYFVCQWFALSALETSVLVIFFALPTASASYILTKVLKGDSDLMAAVISVQTVCAVITLPIILAYLM